MQTILEDMRSGISEEGIRLGGEILKQGGLVAFPTETVYGLGGNALDAEASAKIYAAKGRPSDNPLIVHIADWEAIRAIVSEIPEAAKQLADAFWPGPLTMILNKSDLADPVWNKKWVEYFSNQGMGVLEINSRTGMGIKSIQGLVQEVCKEKIERDRKRGIVNRPVRAMVVGIPNVGKSTFINSFAGKACAKTGNKPGVTKGKQWIRLNKGLELLDTPGILWPKFEDQQVGMRLAFIGSMNDEILIPDELACDLIGAIKELYPKALQERYEADPAGKPIEILEAVAESRKCYAKGEQLDLGKAAGILIDDFRSGKLGRITLERI